MVTKLKASLDSSGAIADWNFEVWSNTHSMRPGGAGVDAGGAAHGAAFRRAGAKAAAVAGRRRRSQRDPDLQFSQRTVVHHFIPAMPVRISAMRALGAYHNVFSIESFMDELADSPAPIPSSSG